RLLVEIKHREWEASDRHEIKVRITRAMVAPAAGDTIMVSSFDLNSLVYAHQCRPDIPLIYNFEVDQTIDDAQNVLAAQPFLYGLCLPIETIDALIVDFLRSHGKCIAVYTCNSDNQINKALTLGVDILISDVPQKALQMRDG
ncbi:MAG: glycerophosphodiester phosphodiesterase family protein, partial [Gallionella sp.]